MKNKLPIRHYISTICAIIFTFTSGSAFSQIFDFEQSPPSVKWRQINTESYQLIFPVEAERSAQYTANLLDKSMRDIRATLRTNPRKIPIILRNQSVSSNGFVQLSPWRSEFFITPPQNSDPLNWLESLTIHEYRHVVQIGKLKAKPPFELIGLAYFGISLPPWVYEGDAVAMETVLTTAGRGRLPSWEMPLRANLMEGINHSYQKNYLGSLKDITAGYYPLGYFMTTKIRSNYGPTILDSVFNRMSRMPLRPYNFSKSLKKYTQRSTRQWHTETMADLNEKWKMQLVDNNALTYPLSYGVDSTERNDLFLPQEINTNQVLALSINQRNTASIILIDSLGNSQEIIKTGMQTYPNFSYSSGRLTWDEIRFDKRYSKQDYNVINTFDLSTNRYKQLSHKSRFFSPTLNKDASQIATIDISKSNDEFLVLLNAETGEELNRISAPEDTHLQTPSFHPNGKNVIAVGISKSGANLVEFDLSNNSSKILLNHISQQFERPIYADDLIIFKASYNGIDNLYSLNPISEEVLQLTNIRYGAFNPSYNNSSNTLLFNNYQSFGYQISKVKLDEIDPTSINGIKNTFINYFEPLLKQEAKPISQDSILQKAYVSKPYKELANLFNFHSISVGSDNFESIGDLKLGLLLLSDNLLNTLSIRVGAAYNKEVSRPEFTTTLTYQRYLPKFNIHYENSGKLSGIKLDPKVDKVSQVRWRENEIKINTEIPLRFNRLNTMFHTGFKVGTSYTQRYNMDTPALEKRFIKKLKFPLDYQVYFNRNSRTSRYDLAPKWGQNISLFYRSSPFEKQLTGEAFSIRSSFYFPGVMTNHSLRTRFSFQHHNGQFQYSNYIPMVNGYDLLPASLPKNTLLVDYRFPIAYPDWELGPLAYIQRLKGGFFTHFENFADHGNTKPRTFGAELRADVNLLRFLLPVFDVGVTAIYVNEPVDKKWLFQFGFSYSH